MNWTTAGVKYDDPELLDPDDDWGHRRANMRHEVALPGVITDRQGIRVRCDIEDVSATGMALAIEMITDKPGREPLKQGTLATLEFAPDPVGAPDEIVTATVHIAWRAPVAVGVRFEDPSPALRAALRRVAESAVTQRVEQTNGARQEMTPSQRAILQACRKTVQLHLPNMLWVLRTELIKKLRTAAEAAKGAEQRAIITDADLLEDKSMAITRTIEHQFLQGFGEASDLEQTQELTMMQLKAAMNDKNKQALNVEQDSAAEHGARIAALAHAVEERFKSKFFELNVRMANVLGHPLDEKSNPLVPGSACRILWQGVIGFGDSPRIEKCLQQTLVHHVLPLLGELYDAINKTLDERGAKRIFDVRQNGQTRPPE